MSSSKFLAAPRMSLLVTGMSLALGSSYPTDVVRALKITAQVMPQPVGDSNANGPDHYSRVKYFEQIPWTIAEEKAFRYISNEVYHVKVNDRKERNLYENSDIARKISNRIRMSKWVDVLSNRIRMRCPDLQRRGMNEKWVDQDHQHHGLTSVDAYYVKRAYFIDLKKELQQKKNEMEQIQLMNFEKVEALKLRIKGEMLFSDRITTKVLDSLIEKLNSCIERFPIADKGEGEGGVLQKVEQALCLYAVEIDQKFLISKLHEENPADMPVDLNLGNDYEEFFLGAA